MTRQYSVEKYFGVIGFFDFVVKIYDERNSLCGIFTITYNSLRLPEVISKNFKLSTGQFGYEFSNAWNKFIRYVNSGCSRNVLDDINQYDQHLFD